jgi:caffeoyl-CoA O-methyltransferase
MIPLVDVRIEEYAHAHTTPENDILRKLAEQTQAEMRSPQMLSGRVEGTFLRFLVQILRPGLVVEVGTFTGYSALSIAEGLPEGGRLITCEVDPKARSVAQEAFDASPHGKKIDLRFGPALDTIRGIVDPIDFSFIDADKEAYPEYYEELVQRTRPGGLILLDNALWSGRVLDPEDEETRAIDDVNRRAVTDERVECVMLTIRDGVLLVRKRG